MHNNWIFWIIHVWSSWWHNRSCRYGTRSCKIIITKHVLGTSWIRMFEAMPMIYMFGSCIHHFWHSTCPRMEGMDICNIPFLFIPNYLHLLFGLSNSWHANIVLKTLVEWICTFHSYHLSFHRRLWLCLVRVLEFNRICNIKIINYILLTKTRIY